MGLGKCSTSSSIALDLCVVTGDSRFLGIIFVDREENMGKHHMITINNINIVIHR